jgi:hypothetical protein
MNERGVGFNRLKRRVRPRSPAYEASRRGIRQAEKEPIDLGSWILDLGSWILDLEEHLFYLVGPQPHYILTYFNTVSEGQDVLEQLSLLPMPGFGEQIYLQLAFSAESVEPSENLRKRSP